ncbi:hypothetical protein HMPREF1981_01941 [Bacteroides pyogenes F0041]|uniref:Uncharacterized protein n=1 Tax=Bacteroides pyogenes F0041 TaxID=1321819 RepID=U2CMG0_9BACE|nr:hypothetical protein HMPREF1981_01941 [Bacteroides pyogenes F0041]
MTWKLGEPNDKFEQGVRFRTPCFFCFLFFFSLLSFWHGFGISDERK